MKNAATPPLAIAGWLTGAAQAHLCKNGVTVGDVFLFFGVFARSLSARCISFFLRARCPHVGRPLGSAGAALCCADRPQRPSFGAILSTCSGVSPASLFASARAP